MTYEFDVEKSVDNKIKYLTDGEIVRISKLNLQYDCTIPFSLSIAKARAIEKAVLKANGLVVKET